MQHAVDVCPADRDEPVGTGRAGERYDDPHRALDTEAQAAGQAVCLLVGQREIRGGAHGIEDTGRVPTISAVRTPVADQPGPVGE